MKISCAKLILSVVVLGSASVADAARERWETLHAINMVENPTNHARPGRHGELGPYQFRSATWRMHTDRPFSQAINREAADVVAVKHYEWIKRSLENRGVESSAFNIAMAWNCGVDNVVRGRAPAVSYNYAVRVTNIMSELQSREQTGSTSMVDDREPLKEPDVESIPVLKLDEFLSEPEPAVEPLRFRLFPSETKRFVLTVD